MCFDVEASHSRFQGDVQTGLSLQHCCWPQDEARDVMVWTNIRTGAVI